MAPYRPKLTPEQQERYNEIVARTPAQKVRRPPADIGALPEDHIVLRSILSVGDVWVGKRPSAANFSANRLRRRGYIETTPGHKRGSWRLTQKGQAYVEEVGLRPLEFPV